jgi:hypothetical protein
MRKTLILIGFIGVVTTSCAPAAAPPPAPTRIVLSGLPTATPPGAGGVAATFTPTTRSTESVTAAGGSGAMATLAALASSGEATPGADGSTTTTTVGDMGVVGADTLTIDAVETTFIERSITFKVYFTPFNTTVKTAVFKYTYPETGKSAEKRVNAKQQKMGVQGNLFTSITADAMPPGEEEIMYEWLLLDQDGKAYSSEGRRFKITESISAEQRKDRPVIAAEQGYESSFPSHSMFTVSVKQPAVPLVYARFLLTQNNGIEQYDVEVPRVPRQKGGETLELSFKWNNSFGPQIPWQQFESWWVFRDQNGKEWRTESAYNVYSDTRYHKWIRTKTKHAELFTYGRSQADINVLVASTDYSIERLSKEFDYKLLYRPHIVVYNSQQDMADWAPAQWVDYFIGMASGQWGGAVVAWYKSARFTGYTIIQHELVHIFQYQSLRTTKQLVPRWWVEGSATYFEEQEENVLGRVRKICRAYGRCSLLYGATMSAPDGSGVPWLYYVGSSFVAFLREKYGPAVFSEIHAAIARDIRFTDALKMATGQTFERLNAEWQVWIEK